MWDETAIGLDVDSIIGEGERDRSEISDHDRMIRGHDGGPGRNGAHARFSSGSC